MFNDSIIDRAFSADSYTAAIYSAVKADYGIGYIQLTCSIDTATTYNRRIIGDITVFNSAWSRICNVYGTTFTCCCIIFYSASVD